MVEEVVQAEEIQNSQNTCPMQTEPSWLKDENADGRYLTITEYSGGQRSV